MHDHRRARRPDGDLRLLRSRDAVLGGVAAGVADFAGANPRLVRLLWLLSLPLSGGVTAAAYLLLWLLLPRASGVEANPDADSGSSG